MSVPTDDQLIDEFYATVKRDDQLKRELAVALRTKDDSALRQAVRWVVETLIKPGVKAVWDGVIRRIEDFIRGGW